MTPALLGYFFLAGGWPVDARQRKEGSISRVIRLFDQGKNVAEIGREVGKHHLAVYRYLVKAGKVPHSKR